MDTLPKAATPAGDTLRADELYERARAAEERGNFEAAAQEFALAESCYERLGCEELRICSRFGKEQCWARLGDARAGNLPAVIPASPEERESILENWRWFSKFSAYDKLRIAYRQRRMARLFQEMARARKRLGKREEDREDLRAPQELTRQRDAQPGS